MPTIRSKNKENQTALGATKQALDPARFTTPAPLAKPFGRSESVRVDKGKNTKSIHETARRTILGDKNVFTALVGGPKIGEEGKPAGGLAVRSGLEKGVEKATEPKTKTFVFLDSEADDLNREIEYIPDPVPELPFVPYVHDGAEASPFGLDTGFDYDALARACRGGEPQSAMPESGQPTARQTSLEIIQELGVDMESVPVLPALPSDAEDSDVTEEPSQVGRAENGQQHRSIHSMPRLLNVRKRMLKSVAHSSKTKRHAVSKVGRPLGNSKLSGALRNPKQAGALGTLRPSAQLEAQIQGELRQGAHKPVQGRGPARTPGFMGLTVSAAAKMANKSGTVQPVRERVEEVDEEVKYKEKVDVSQEALELEGFDVLPEDLGLGGVLEDDLELGDVLQDDLELGGVFKDDLELGDVLQDDPRLGDVTEEAIEFDECSQETAKDWHSSGQNLETQEIRFPTVEMASIVGEMADTSRLEKGASLELDEKEKSSKEENDEIPKAASEQDEIPKAEIEQDEMADSLGSPSAGSNCAGRLATTGISSDLDRLNIEKWV